MNLADDPGGGGVIVHPIRRGFGLHPHPGWPIFPREVRLRRDL